MQRRGFFAAALAVAVGLLGGWAGRKLRAVTRLDERTGEWVRVRMYELRIGDTFRIAEEGLEGYDFVANSEPYYIAQDGTWGITGEGRMRGPDSGM